jgi:IS30 family transposase
LKTRNLKHKPRRFQITKTVDWIKVDKLLEAGCSGVEIAASLGIHPQTLYDRCEKEKDTEFSVYSQQKKQSGDTLLRNAQFEKALDKDNMMLIWLGKQRLDQREPEPRTLEACKPALLAYFEKLMKD